MQQNREDGAQGRPDYIDGSQENFQSGYFRNMNQNISGNEFEPSRTQSQETVQSQSSATFSPWTPDTSHGDQCSSSSLGYGPYWTSPLGEKRQQYSIPISGSHRAPLDGQSSPISSPVSSMEDSNKAGLRHHANVDVPWKPQPIIHSSQDQFNNALNGLQISNGDWPRDGEQKVTSGYNQNARNGLEAASGITKSRPVQSSYPFGQVGNMVPNNLWSDGQRIPFDVEGSFEAHLRSTNTTTVNPASRLPHPMLFTASEATNLYKSYLPNQQALSPTPLTAFPSDTGAEYSIFVGDLSPELREEDLVAQFLQPSPWPASHPFAIAHAHAQQAKGIYGAILKIRPAPFTSTKSAKIMKDPITGASRGFGFVRFSKEEDCNRALVEMQGMVINPIIGPGRPLRVCTATPKNRTVAASPSAPLWPAPSPLNDALSLYQQIQYQQDRLISPTQLEQRDTSATSPTPMTSSGANYFGYPSAMESTPTTTSPVTYSNSALDPNNTTVFVGGLSSLISEETLKTFFGPFGEIIYVKIPPGKGCGFVQFVQKADAERAIERMQGFPIGGGRIRLSWGRSQGDKAAAAAAQAVAQTAQISQLAGLANLTNVTPAQLSHLAGLNLSNSQSSPTNESDTIILRRLAAAATASSNLNSREQEYAALQRAAALRHLPGMEQNHREAQHNHTSSIQEQDNHGRLRDENYLAAMFPSLRLEDLEPKLQPQASPTHANNKRGDYLHPFPLLDEKRMQPMKQNNAFSPFSPPLSPCLLDDLSLATDDNSQPNRPHLV